MTNMMKIIKNILIINIIISVFFTSSSYAMSQEQAGQTLAEFAINFFNNYGKETAYSYSLRENSYNGQKTSGATDKSGSYGSVSFSDKYAFDCVGWISFAVHNSLKIGGDTFVTFGVPPGNRTTGYHNGFEEVLGSYTSGRAIDEDTLYSNAKPGDLFLSTGKHILLYVGDGYVVDSVGGVPTLRYSKKQGTGYSICSVGRITEETAQSLNPNNVTTMFGSTTGAADEFEYYGTTEGSYAGSYTFGQWLFSKFVGFFDYLLGIITYIFRMQFLGWGNIIEELINYTLNKATGVETVTVEKDESQENNEENAQENTPETDKYAPGSENLYKPSANNTNNRLDIEDIIYNRVPFLDVNFLDVNLERYKKLEEQQRAQASDGEEIQVVSEDSVIYALRANIAKWYIVIRQICIILLLLLLIYLGIRLAISTTSKDKAKYKGMLVAWLTSFIVVFCIHYYMMIVIEINEILVDTFENLAGDLIQESENSIGSQSIYDTIRTRAYSLKLSEGFPATIFYLVLIYFLVRFLFIYVKRYFTIMILAIMGPIMAIKNCFDKISTGKSKSMSKWMYDFALNVFLQTIHAILYCIFMVIAFDLSTQSIAGFVMALIVLNFIFKAEKIFMNIFNFEGRASSLKDVNENKNYFAEAYKIGIGVSMFGGTALRYGAGAVKGSGKFLGQSALATTQLGVSAYRRASWSIRNRRAIRNGQDEIEYTPTDVKGSFKNAIENVKNNMADGANNIIYKGTGWFSKTKLGDKIGAEQTRSVRLDLHNIKKRDPGAYEKAKKALELKKELKYKTLKRTLGDSAKSIRYMSELMVGIPMLVVDTQSGFSTLMDATSGLKDMNHRDLGYGHKRTINRAKGNIGTKALNAATFGALNATQNSREKLEKEMKKIRENNFVLEEIKKANNLEFEIQKEVEKMIANGDKDKKIDDIMKEALSQVMSGSKVKKAVSEYMAENGIKDLSEKNLNEIMDKINNQMFADNVDKIVNKYMKDNDKEYLDKTDFDKILEKMDKKAESGVSSILNDNKKIENMKNINPDVEKITMDYMKEKGVIKLGEDDKNEIDKRVNEQLYRQVKDERDKFMKDQDIDKLSVEQVKELLKSDASRSSFGIDITDEVKQNVAKQFKDSNSTLDKKKTVNAIEDAIKATGTANSSDLSKMMRELKTLKEKTKNNYGATIVDLGEFTKGIKGKMG